MVRLTLEQARQLALNNNKALTLARMNVDQKRIGIASARSSYFPQVLGNFTYLRFNNSLGTVLTTQTGRLGILPVGSKETAVNLLRRNSSFGTLLAVQSVTKLIVVNAAEKIARADTRIAQIQLEKGAREVISGVTQLYYGLIGAQRLEQMLSLQVNGLKQLAAVKSAPQLTIAMLEAEKGLAETESQIKELKAQFNSLLDLPACTVVELVDPLPPPLPYRCAEEAIQLALTNHPEIQEARQNIVKAQQALRINKASYLPDVYLFGGYQNQNAFTVVQNNYAFVGVTASYTFIDWGKRRHQKRQAELTIALANQQMAVVTNKIRDETRKAYVEYERSARMLSISERLIQAYKDAEKTATTPQAIAQAKGMTAKAQLDHLQAELNYRLAHAKLNSAVGQP